MSDRVSARQHHQTGFTLVELMIGMTLSLVVILAVTATFVNGMYSRTELERSTNLVENGRYATQTLIADLQTAGFFAELDMRQAAATKDITADIPDPCDSTLANLRLSWPFSIQGYDATDAQPIDCLNDWKAGTDVVVVRRLSTCVAGTPNCATVAGAPYFQISACGNPTELGDADSDSWYALDTQVAELIKTQRDCATPAPARRYRQHIYFVANNDIGSDKRPTLKRMELVAGGFNIEPIANGVEEFQVEYGVDSDADGSPDAYTANPTNFNGCADADCRRANWRNVTSVKLYLLIRADKTSSGSLEPKIFTLGLDAQGAPVTMGPYSDKYERQLFSTSATLRNVVGLRR